MKKVITSILIIFSLFLFACSPSNLSVREASFPTDSVATLSIFSYNGKGESKFGIKNLGHSFLSLTNTSSSDIELCGKTLSPGEEIYFGAWSLSVHFGIWYNVESNYIEFYNKYNGRVSVDKGVTLEEIEKISDFILENDKWSPLNNCSKFAIRLWNSLATDKEKLSENFVNTPAKLIEELKTFENYQVNKPLNFYEDCGYFADLTNESFEFIGGEVYV